MKTSEKAKGMNKMRSRMYIEAQTRPKLSGLGYVKETRVRYDNITHIGVSYVFNKSLPFKFACTNLGPSAGTRWTVASIANIEKPRDACSPGRAGNGSISGRITNHSPRGTRTP